MRGGYAGYGSVTVGVANGSGTFAGSLQDSGNNGGRLTFIKAGSGTQTLTGISNYTGLTTVNGGTLRIDNSPGASQSTSGTLSNTSGVVVNSGGTLLLAGGSSSSDRINNAAP